VIGEIETFLDQRIHIDQPVLAAASARMQKHVLDDGIGPLAVLHDFLQIIFHKRAELVQLAAHVGWDGKRGEGLVDLVR
jgi:hypothetical protein